MTIIELPTVISVFVAILAADVVNTMIRHFWPKHEETE